MGDLTEFDDVRGSRHPLPPGRRTAPGSPQWGLVMEVADAVFLHGSYMVSMVPLPAQRLVDLQWAAHQAARLLGAKAHIEVDQSVDEDDPTVVVTITFVDPDGRGLRRAQEGLNALLRSVQAKQPAR